MTALLAALAGVGAGLGLVAVHVGRLAGLLRRAPLARVPLAPESAVQLAETGRVDLALEGPLFTTRFAGLSFVLEDPTGLPVPLRAILFRTRQSDFARVRLRVKRCEVTRPGAHRLRVRGLAPDADVADCAVVFVRPNGVALAALIVGLIASALLAAGSLVASALLLAGDGGPVSPSR